jgi:hypothetical protein
MTFVTMFLFLHITVTVFHDRPLPKDAAMVAGYAWLIQDYARLAIGSVDSFFATKQRILHLER